MKTYAVLLLLLTAVSMGNTMHSVAHKRKAHAIDVNSKMFQSPFATLAIPMDKNKRPRLASSSEVEQQEGEKEEEEEEEEGEAEAEERVAVFMDDQSHPDEEEMALKGGKEDLLAALFTLATGDPNHVYGQGILAMHTQDGYNFDYSAPEFFVMRDRGPEGMNFNSDDEGGEETEEEEEEGDNETRADDASSFPISTQVHANGTDDAMKIESITSGMRYIGMRTGRFGSY